jgi:hypothetical protein
MEEQPAPNEGKDNPSSAHKDALAQVLRTPVAAALENTKATSKDNKTDNTKKDAPILSYWLARLNEWRKRRPKREPATNQSMK